MNTEEKLAKLREGLEQIIEDTAEKNPEYAERLRAQLDSVQPDLDDLQDMVSDAELGGVPSEDDDDGGESRGKEDEEEGEGGEA